MSGVSKPLGIKAYGSIGHLPNSRMGPGDHHVSEGQARICTVKVRDRHDTIILQEKLDGSCVAVARIDDQIIALGRAGWPAWSSPYEQHRLFADWVNRPDNWARFMAVLQPGERLVGEWLAQAHGTIYVLAGPDASSREPFVAFDLMTAHERLPFDAFRERVAAGEFATPPLVHIGGAMSVSEALQLLGPYGRYGATDLIEGVVYRVERRGAVDFLAKYVRPDKADGIYLPEVSGGQPIWNWRPAD